MRAIHWALPFDEFGDNMFSYVSNRIHSESSAQICAEWWDENSNRSSGVAENYMEDDPKGTKGIFLLGLEVEPSAIVARFDYDVDSYVKDGIRVPGKKPIKDSKWNEAFCDPHFTGRIVCSKFVDDNMYMVIKNKLAKYGHHIERKDVVSFSDF